MEKLKQEADRLGKSSFAFAFYMDRQKEERERGVTISCTTKEFFTDKWHYTIIDAPGMQPPSPGQPRDTRGIGRRPAGCRRPRTTPGIGRKTLTRRPLPLLPVGRSP